MFTQLSVSGLHRLFTTSPTTSHPSHEQQHLESVTEEAHTHDLLYPTIEALLHAQQQAAPLGHINHSVAASAANSFDDHGDLELHPGDIRVIIAQDGNSISQQPRIIYDSLPQPTRPQSSGSPNGIKKDNRRSWDGPRSAEAGTMRTQGGRRSSTSGYSPKSPSENDMSPVSPQQDSRGAFSNLRSRRREAVDGAEESETSFAKLIIGRQEEANTLLGCMFGSTGLSTVSSTKIHINPLALETHVGSAGSMRRSNGSSSVRLHGRHRTSLTHSMTPEELQTIVASRRAVETAHVPITYGESSTLITRVFSVEKPIPFKMSVEESTAQSEGSLSTGLGNEKVKQSKVPRYAVGLVLRLPQGKIRLHGSDSLLARSVPTSVDESWSSRAFEHRDARTTDYEVERLMTHWTNLTRVLTLLEAMASSEIQRQLSQYHQVGDSDAPACQPEAAPNRQLAERRKKGKQAFQRTIQLPGMALQQSSSIVYGVQVAQCNLASALNTRRVVTGQARWGVWREEARWISRWSKSKEQDFVYILLTAFFGNHNQWLRSTRFDWVRPHIFAKPAEEATILSHRTVIICPEKMAARRLIFLLSAFFPSTFVLSRMEKPERPFSSRSNSALSASPPTGAPLSREVSLRRTINRRPKGERIGSPSRLHERSISFPTPESPIDDDIPDSSPRHGRRTSDARSIRSLALPIPQSSNHTRKSSISTDATVVIGGDLPVAHFSGVIPNRGGTTPTPRPGSSGSLASLSLKRTLSRSDSSGFSPTSPSGSRWGSMLSSFWSTGRGSSTEASDPMTSSHDGLGISGISYSTSPHSPSKLARMVAEAAPTTKESLGNTRRGPPSPETTTEATPAKDIPEREKLDEFPLKLSVDTSDGVIDIDIPPTNSYPSSYGSSLNSPHPAHIASSSYNEHSNSHNRTSAMTPSVRKEDSAVDVAGWLKRYHPDFALQAVSPYKAIIEDIKESMRMEPTQETCTTLIADSTTSTITRLILRAEAATKTGNQPSLQRTFVEEKVTSRDPVLASALDRIFAQTGQPPHPQSRDSSPMRQASSQLNPEVTGRECKKIIMNALIEVTKSVMTEADRSRNIEESPTVNEVKTKDMTSNPLRQGIKQWLEAKSMSTHSR